jgi:hypothetical protein
MLSGPTIKINTLVNDVKFEVLTAVKILMLVFWVVRPCGLVGRYQHFVGTYCLHL